MHEWSTTVPSDARPVRDGEQLDWPALERWLRGHLPAATRGGGHSAVPMEVLQFRGGHSNLTYLLRFGSVELVLRRAPFGPVASTAHDMTREYRWLAALHPVFPAAPQPYRLCEDDSIIGSVFYVMERRSGMVIRQEEPPLVAGRAELRHRISAALVDALANLHAIDANADDLAPLGRPSGFVERQVRGWSERWHRSKTREVAAMDRVGTWLLAHLPRDPGRPAVVHGDFKLDNVMLDMHDPGRIAAVLDWEMVAAGDPLVDLGILLTYWSHARPGDGSDALKSVTSSPGWFSRDEILEHYARRSARDVSGIRFYEIFAMFKVAVIVQQIFFRWIRGQTADPRFARFDVRVAQLAHDACALIDAA